MIKVTIIDVTPNEKIVWLVTDCHLSWLQNKTEWTNTQISFEILTKDSETEMKFTHIGLVPEIECYDMCIKGWNQYIKESL